MKEMGGIKLLIDKVPPKSTYYDRNRSDLVVSKSITSPSKRILKKLYQSSRRYFK